jgi:hypothetical protein
VTALAATDALNIGAEKLFFSLVSLQVQAAQLLVLFFSNLTLLRPTFKQSEKMKPIFSTEILPS